MVSTSSTNEQIARTLTSELPAATPGEQVRLDGWVHRRRELAKITFLVVRDRSGLAQVVLPAGTPVPPEETPVTVTGIATPNEQAPGGVEVTEATVTALGAIIATISAAAIQLWFRVQAKRSQFRRRQTSSRLATFAEAVCSIGWAATAALAVTIPVAAVISGAMTAAILATTWKISPRRD